MGSTWLPEPPREPWECSLDFSLLPFQKVCVWRWTLLTGEPTCSTELDPEFGYQVSDHAKGGRGDGLGSSILTWYPHGRQDHTPSLGHPNAAEHPKGSYLFL